MNANYVSSFLHLDLNDDGVEDDIQYLNPWGDRQLERLSKDVFVLKERSYVRV